MPCKVSLVAALALFAFAGADCRAQEAKPEKPDASKLPHVTIDVQKKQVRVDAEFVNANMPLEFFCCKSGTAEHETVLRSAALPSHIHLGLLMVGLKPGEPVRFSKAADRWLPPAGPPIHIFCEWAGKDGKTVRYPAYRLMRNVKTKKEMPPMTWVFCGSRTSEDGQYVADATGYTVTVVNFDFALIDIPDLVSNKNETLEWEFNADLCPPKGTRTTMILEPAAIADEKAGDKPADNSGDAAQPATGTTTVNPDNAGQLSDVRMDEEKVKRLRAEWEKVVRPQAKVLKEITETHYKVIERLRAEQNRLIDEADRIQRVIEQLQKEYQDYTTPQPERAKESTEPK